jgi:exonuclease SbcC
MKFKKVEISAFRIYDKPADATFDFTINSGEAADFVSIYAPNGFGKTSFYDAVEWGVTNDIQRFWQNDDITNEAISALREINEEKQVKILRNRHAAPDLETSVRIITDSADMPERKFNVHGNSSSDIKSSGTTERKSFQRVILSQEWISAFLKENRGDKRYEKFMEDPELKGLDDYYKKVKAIVATCERTIQELVEAINEQKKKITELEDKNFLETINKAIQSLKNRGEVLEMITPNTTDKSVLGFNDKISGRLTDFSKLNDHLRQILAVIDIAKSGNEQVAGIELYYQNLASHITFLKELGKIDETLQQFSELLKWKNDLNVKQDQRNKLSAEQNDFNLLLQSYEEYERIYNLLQDKLKVTAEYQKQLAEISQQFSLKRDEEAGLKVKFESNLRQITEASNAKAKIPALKLKIEIFNNSIASANVEISKLATDRDNKIQTRQELDKYEGSYSRFILAIEAGNFLMEIPDDLQIETGSLHGLIDLKKRVAEIQAELSGIDLRLNQQETFNLSLKEFVTKGIEIVNNTKTAACPLCTQDYDSYEQLAKKITSNQLLTLAIQELLRQKTESQNRQIEAETLFKERCQQIIDICLLNRTANQDRLSNLINNLQALDLAIITKEKERDGLQNDLLVLKGEINNLSPEDYEKAVDDLIKELEDERNSLTESIRIVSGELRNNDEKINELKTLIKNNEDDITKHAEDTKYLLVLAWFRNNLQSDYGRKEVLNLRVADLVKNIGDLDASISSIQKTIEKYQGELGQFTEEGLNSQKRISQTQRDKTALIISTYETFISRNLSLVIKGEPKDKVLQLLKEQEEKAALDIQATSHLNTDYMKLVEYSKNLLPFLQSESAKAAIKNSEEQVQFLTNEVQPKIEKERDSIKNFLEQKIKDFFYTELINQIYNKIDPHPDFKGVEFKADFGSDSPRLDVLVTNSLNQQKLIPNLYFSTAQINILSLSIFLASALNSNEYNCIFIDDPIQSMDSINVLSTIDLLRGIVATGEKQIVLSTHDENFHNLLQKKMPSDLFKSKFLEFETFGKVKQN